MEYKGYLLSRGKIKSMLGKDIIITPYNESKLKNPWYALHPHKVWFDFEKDFDEPSYDVVHIDEKTPFVLDPKSYVEIEMEERIKLTDGLVGLFIPASYSITKGIMITVGKLDSNYEERIMFGIFNAKNHPIDIYDTVPIAYLAIFDLRDDMNDKAELSKYDKGIRATRSPDEVKDVVDKIKELIEGVEKGGR